MTPLASPIRLLCSECAKWDAYPRDIDPGLPNRVKTIVIICPDCDDGDFHEEVWLDVLNREVSQDEPPQKDTADE